MRYSVIIPVHNREKDVEKCLESVINQTYKDFEIIAVDDGSTDNSGKILDEYAKKYDFIKVIHKSNGGLSSARNCGVKFCLGEYVLFLDDDDEWIENLFEKVDDFYGCDLVAFGYEIVYNDSSNKRTIAEKNATTDVISAVKILENYGAFNMTWNKAYKRELILGVEFLSVMPCEDIIFNCEVFKKVKSVALLKDALYVYNCKQDVSLANSYNGRLEENVAIANEKRCELYNEIGFLGEQADEIYASKYIGYEFSKIPNIFRKKNGLKRKEKYKKLKAIIKDEKSREYFKKTKVSGLKKLFKFHVKTKTPFLAYINFSFLFFIRNNFGKVYKKIRRK